MRFTTKHKPNMDDVRKVALAALVSAMDDKKDEAKKKPGLTGVRAVATGAVIYTAGKAAFSSRRFIRDHLGSNGGSATDEEEIDDEPRGEDEEDFDDEDFDEDEDDEDDDEDEEEDEEEDDI
jgi:hypothetical protein